MVDPSGGSGGSGARSLRAVIRAILPFFARLDVIGLDQTTAGGRLLFCNHTGWADPIWIAYAVYPRFLHQMAKRELFRWAWAARLIGALGAFPVDRTRPSTATLRHAAALLRAGGWLLVFPTGTRDRTQTEARRGAALIALMADTPIVPVHYGGPTEIRLVHLLTRPKIHVRFGPSIEINSPLQGREITLELTARMERALKALTGSSPESFELR